MFYRFGRWVVPRVPSRRGDAFSWRVKDAVPWSRPVCDFLGGRSIFIDPPARGVPTTPSLELPLSVWYLEQEEALPLRLVTRVAP